MLERKLLNGGVLEGFCFAKGVIIVVSRHYPVGAEVVPEGVHFRVWAPECQHVSVQFRSGLTIPLDAEKKGYHSGLASNARADDLYLIKCDQHLFLPDPASRFQPSGPHGQSQVIDPDRFKWKDADWRGRPLGELVIYELHVGTFTPEGTWVSATRQLAELARLGITCIEVMPVAEFPGEFGWGYDGVALFAPSHLYGTPDDFRDFVNTAHHLGVAVILDVVYNHLGPDGNYLHQLSRSYFSPKHHTDWGAAINFDGPDSGPVREFYLTNVTYWIQEFHLDGLRLDATQNIYDESPAQRHILTEIGKAARAAAPHRVIILIAENEPQDGNLCRPVENGGNGLDAIWNDDFHHSAMVALTGQREAYFSDYQGSPQEFISLAKFGFLYQGQWYSWQKQSRGRSSVDLPHTAFVSFLQNHDQIANSGKGQRAHQKSSPGRYRALHAFTMLQPSTPMLFQGQEFAASAPFLFFADHKEELAKLVQKGRQEFLQQFPRLRDQSMIAQLAPPHDAATFQRCKLNLAERESHSAEYQMTSDLLRIRRTLVENIFGKANKIDGAVIGHHAFLLRLFAEDPGSHRILLVNLGADLSLPSLAEPLFAPPVNNHWMIAFSSESVQYGGNGVRDLQLDEGGIHLPAEATLLLEPIWSNERP